jgi:hypothetical protein
MLLAHPELLIVNFINIMKQLSTLGFCTRGPLTYFTHFPKLPVEIRSYIWLLVSPPRDRLVQIREVCWFLIVKP